MRVLDCTRTVKSPNQGECRWRYGLLVEDIEVDGFHCESYGFLIADELTGRKTRCRHVTVNANQALELLGILACHKVSPIHLLEVVEDHLGK